MSAAAGRAQLSWWGQGTYQVDDAGQDWRSRLDTVARALTWQSQAIDLAFVRLTAAWTLDWTSLQLKNPLLPYVQDFDVTGNQPLWKEFTPDAHGMQLLTAAHVGRARSLDAWNVEAVGGERYLVQARDLGSWYAGTEPDAEVLAAARADFGDMILTRAAIEECSA